MYVSLIASCTLSYYGVWRYLPRLYTLFGVSYRQAFPDMSWYYPLLASCGVVVLTISGILIVGLTIKIGRILGDLL